MPEVTYYCIEYDIYRECYLNREEALRNKRFLEQAGKKVTLREITVRVGSNYEAFFGPQLGTTD